VGKGWKVINTNYDVTKITFELFEIHTPMCFEIIYKLGVIADSLLTMLLASFDPLYFVAFDLGYVWSFVRSFDLRHFGLNIFILSSGPFFSGLNV